MRFTLKARLAASFAAVLLLTAVSAYLAIDNLGLLNQRFDAAVSGPVLGQRLVLTLENDLSLLARSEKIMISETDDQKIASLAGDIKRKRGDIQADMAGLVQQTSGESRKKLEEMTPFY